MSALSEAFLSAQKNLPQIAKDSDADTGKFHYRYLSLEGLLRQVLPVLHDHGLFLIQEPGIWEGRQIMWTRILHFSGDEYKSSMLLPVPLDATAQMVGSAQTYVKRYMLLAMLGLAPDEDDDGAKASRPAAADLTASHHAAGREETSGAAVRSAHGNAAPEEPKTAADAPTRQQHAQLAVLLKELDDGREMNLAYWTDEARDYIRRRYNKVSRTQLTREEMSSLIGWAEDRAVEMGVPFGD